MATDDELILQWRVLFFVFLETLLLIEEISLSSTLMEVSAEKFRLMDTFNRSKLKIVSTVGKNSKKKKITRNFYEYCNIYIKINVW